jgi:hypothetical protein
MDSPRQKKYGEGGETVLRCSVSEKLGPTAEVRKWGRRAEIDEGQRP